ncbi:MAG: adenosine deaminase [Eubacteriales bacterium]|nr:adenosine deaminase [Eubacteriales bacterium]
MKVELHCHLDGSLSPSYIRSQLGEDITLSQLQVSEDCRNLAEYLEKFDLPLLCMQTEEGLRRAGYDFIQSCAAENVQYVEVRFAPMLSLQKGLSPEHVIQAVLEGLEQGKQKFAVDYQVIVCAMRHHSQEENLRMLKAARLFLREGVCAADLAGNEAAYPMTEFVELFDQVKKMNMPFTIHAGECGNAKNIRDAIEAGAKRIGHGIAMRGNGEIQKLCRERHIGIEMCPRSNLQTKAVEELSRYPLREFLDHGLLVTINTDNRTVSNSTLTKEFQFVQESFGITDEEMMQMTGNAIEVSFAGDEVKERLYRELNFSIEKSGKM